MRGLNFVSIIKLLKAFSFKSNKMLKAYHSHILYIFQTSQKNTNNTTKKHIKRFSYLHIYIFTFFSFRPSSNVAGLATNFAWMGLSWSLHQPTVSLSRSTGISLHFCHSSPSMPQGQPSSACRTPNWLCL